MDFSTAEADGGMIPGSAIFLFILGYLVAAVFIARRFGIRGLWGVWAAAVVVGVVGLAQRGPMLADLQVLLINLSFLAIPTATCALVIARTLRRAPPVRLGVQLALGGAGFVAALPLVLVAVVAIVLATS